MTRRVWDMPFGAQVVQEGVRFRLWAPSLPQIELLLEGSPPLPMRQIGGGWCEHVVSDARAGQTYHYRLPDGRLVPDPASRRQAPDFVGGSIIVDPGEYDWRDGAWRGRPWSQAVIYEAHVGTVTPNGTFDALRQEVPRLADLGVTALQLMPVADCPGARNWGYDGVLPFAPNAAYGTPEDLKALVDEAHAHGLMVLLDVVYNHFGPAGNYLHEYARDFFTARHQTPWGAGLNFDGEAREAVRTFFVQNACYWISEYNFDGLRLDAVHAISDDSTPHILDEIAATVRALPVERPVHLVLENEHNEARWLTREKETPKRYTAQWNDDLHHCWHVLLTGEAEGYYADFTRDTPALLARALAQGFVYQGDPSPFHNGAPRGEPSQGLPPCAFIDFLQNHDQIGNRAFGERLDVLADPHQLALARALLLLCPHTPMLFMGEEAAVRQPFQYFVDFSADPELSEAVRRGRRAEFSHFAAFSQERLDALPDPTDIATFERSKLDPSQTAEPHAAQALVQTRHLLALRATHVTPLLDTAFLGSSINSAGDPLIDVEWRFAGGRLRAVLNVGAHSASTTIEPGATPVFCTAALGPGQASANLEPWTGMVLRGPPHA